MRRAAASETPTTPDTDSRPSKRARTSLAEQSSPLPTPDAEELKRDAALERVGREKGETKWVLSSPSAQPATDKVVVAVSLGELDRMGGAETGRRRFGAAPAKVKEDSEDSEDEHEGDLDGIIGKARREAAREEKRTERKGESKKGQRKSRPSGGISSGGGGGGGKRKSIG